MPFKKGEGGRKVGATGKVSRAFKEAVLVVFNDLGGTGRFLQWAEADDGKNLTEFYKIAARLIPHEVIGPGEKGEHLIKTIVDEHRHD
jgi:hypothetical protein